MEPVNEPSNNEMSEKLKEKPRMYSEWENNNDLENESSNVNPWWERIISNRH